MKSFVKVLMAWAILAAMAVGVIGQDLTVSDTHHITPVDLVSYELNGDSITGSDAVEIQVGVQMPGNPNTFWTWEDEAFFDSAPGHDGDAIVFAHEGLSIFWVDGVQCWVLKAITKDTSENHIDVVWLVTPINTENTTVHTLDPT